MFFRKEKKEMISKMQECLEGIQSNNIALADTIQGISENQKQLREGLGAMQAENVALATTVKGLAESEGKLAEGLVEIQTKNDALATTLDGVLEANRSAFTELVDSRSQMQDVVDNVQANNMILAGTLQSVVEASPASGNSEVKKLYTKEEKWKAAYALNLCTVSISQIIEYNDLRFMDQEYENILNNLNLEMMPKDEALLDVLKQILDVIAFFRIEEKERKLLEKEYQQKMKDAIWSAAPNPSVIMAGGSGGWIGIAVTAVISIGTGYMNYRKEKAKIGLEQERKEWELERSLMEQLHGLRRQLFETAWRLADEYSFSDELRLTEKQIKQFNEMLQDDDPLRQYYRLEYIQKQFEAYPPFWYYLGSAALKVADKFSSDRDVCRSYLDKANASFDRFFEQSAFENKLLREDPTVAQCAFEYIAMLESKEHNGCLTVSQDQKRRLIGEKLDLAVRSSGNSLDVMQLCALNYLATDRANEAIPLLRMLVNEFYNVSSNAHLLSMLLVKMAVTGDADSKADYRILTQTCPYKIEFYPMPAVPEKADLAELDKIFCQKQKGHLGERYLKAIEAYLNLSEARFNDLWSRDYDITDEMITYFQDMATAMDILRPGKGETIVKEELTSIFESIENQAGIGAVLRSTISRSNYGFAEFVSTMIECIVTEVIDQLYLAEDYHDISAMESKLVEFCNRYLLVNEKNEIKTSDADSENTIDSIVTGKSLAQSKLERKEFEEYFAAIKEAKLNGTIVANSSHKDREVECYYSDSRQYEEYYIRNASMIKWLDGRVLAVFEDKKGVMRNDLVMTTKFLYVISRPWYSSESRFKYIVPYDLIRRASKKNAIEFSGGRKIYDQDPKGIDYVALGELLHKMRVIYEKYNMQNCGSASCRTIMQNAQMRCAEMLQGVLCDADDVGDERFITESRHNS